MAALLIYRLPALERAVGLSKSTIYQMIRSGTFPEPIKLAPKTVGWRVNEVEAWLANRPRQRIGRPQMGWCPSWCPKTKGPEGETL